MKRISPWSFSLLILFAAVAISVSPATAADAGDKRTYILDQTGEKWDIDQAESLGFKKEKFQHGIGRHAFTTLDGSLLQSETAQVPMTLRVIGVAAGKEAQAYSVSKLRRHEIANTTLDAKPIAVGY